MGQIRDLLEQAQRALGYRDHTPAGMDPEDGHRIPKRARISAPVELSVFLPELVAQHDEGERQAPGRPRRRPVATDGAAVSGIPAAQPAGERDEMGLGDAGFSRSLWAGARLIPLPMNAPVRFAAGMPILSAEPAHYEVTQPAPFQRLEIDPLTGEGEGAVQQLPIARASVDRESLEQWRFATEIPRGMIKERGLGWIEAQLIDSISMGIGRCLDRAAFAAILAALPESPPSSDPFLASGVKAGDLRAIIGRDLKGARGETGALYGAYPHALSNGFGIEMQAEMTADMAETIYGHWAACGIFVTDTIELIADRTSAAGGLRLTAILGAQAVVAAADRFSRAW